MTRKVIPFPRRKMPEQSVEVEAAEGAVIVKVDGIEVWLTVRSAKALWNRLPDVINTAEWMERQP